MKTYNKDLTQELNVNDLDLNLGYLKHCERITILPPQAEILEQGHYEVVAEYENGGQDVEWIIDQPYVPAKEREQIVEEYQVYIPYTEAYLHNKEIKTQIQSFQEHLTNSDFQVLKYIEGYLDEKHFNIIKQSRQHCRDEIKRLTAELWPEEETDE